MASHRCKNKKNANALARKMERKGFNASVYKKKKGYGVSVTRK
jgi:hypothetical protein